MEPQRQKAVCLYVESSNSITLKTEPIQRFVFQAVQDVKPLNQNGLISQAWIEGTKYLVQNLEGKQIQYIITEKRKTFLSGKIFYNGKDIISDMISKGLLKLNKPIQELIQKQEFAKKEKIGLWNSKKISLVSLHQQLAKKKYQNLKSTVSKKCFVQKVEGLKLFLIDIFQNESFIWYMSQLKIPRMNGLDPRKAFISVQDYIKDILRKSIITCEVKGCQIYKGEVSLYGSIHLGNHNLIEQLIKAGYTELSKNAQLIIGKGAVYNHYIELQKQAKIKGFGFYKKKVQKDPIDTTGMSKTNKLKQYEFWIKEDRRVNSLKNPSQQINQILSNYKIQGKQELTSLLLKKLRTLGQVSSVLLTGSGEKYDSQLKQFFQKNCILFSQLSGQLIINLQNIDFMKQINVILRGMITFINEAKDKNSMNDVEKYIKTVFRLTFIGNNIFHAKIFGKEKQIQLDNFSFHTNEFSGSSMSEISDDQRPDRQHIRKKKLNDVYTKIRISASQLIYQTLKTLPNLIQTTWELIVKPNIFSEQFVQYVNSLSFKSQIQPLKIQQKQKLMDLMKINYGEHSLLSLLIFETNQKIKINILNCLQMFICHYQGRKIIQTIQYSKFQKQMKQIKSFIPKSFLVFSAYKNLYYTLIFSISYQRFGQVRTFLFKVVSNLLEQTALLRKLPFEQGIRILTQNFLFPILQSDGASQLKLMVIICFTKMVGTQDKIAQFQTKYLKNNNGKNICKQLIDELGKATQNNQFFNKEIIKQINSFFSCFVTNYFEIFVKVQGESSIWLQLLKLQEIQQESFPTIVQNICKRLNNADIEEEGENVQKQEPKQVVVFRQYFMKDYLPKYLELCQKITSSASLINLLNIYCEIKSDTWNNPLYQKASIFLIQVFQKLSPLCAQIQSPKREISYKIKFQDMRNNPYVRVSYLKLIGYMSLIQKFRTKTIAKFAFQTILTIIKTAKGLNTLIKCSWALSNWCDIQFLTDILTDQQAKLVMEKLIGFTYSQKQKIAAHGIRGLGTYTLNMSKHNILSQQLLLNLKQCLIYAMNNKNPKVSWNALVALRTIIKIKNLNFEEEFGSEFVMNALISNFSINNFKLQLQTVETLKCFSETYVQKYFTSICRQGMNVLQQISKKQLTEYSFKEFKYVDNLNKQIIRYLILNLSRTSVEKFTQIIKNIDLSLLLESIYKYLLTLKVQQEQQTISLIIEKGTQKGEQAEKEIFNVKKKIQFDQEQQVSNVVEPGCRRVVLRINPNDQQFIETLKKVSGKIQGFIQEDQNMKINYSVVEGFQQLNHIIWKQDKAVLKMFEL